MKILIISSGQDTGGQGYRIKRAFDKYAPDFEVRAMALSETFIKYPRDLAWDADLAAQLYTEADVVHHKNGLALYERFDDGQRKPTMIHHQGTRLRDHADAVNAEAMSVGAVQIVSTVDLLADVEGGTWIPSPFDLDAIREKYRRPRKNRTLRIGHAPTNRKAKGTAEIVEVLSRLSRWHDFEVDVIEQVEWKVCLSRKGRCDIYIDQVTHGYGNNTIECWAMGIPVITGWSDPEDRDRFMEQTGIAPPFVEANHETLEDQLETLIRSADLREHYGRIGREFAEVFHSERAVVERLAPIYRAVPPSKGVEMLQRFDDRARKQAEKGMRS